MPVKLEEYTKKRNFEKTPEPKGSVEPQGSFKPAESEQHEALRFAVQHHDARRDHYDLRLEWNGALLSWAVPKGPSYDRRDKRLAVQVEDHPLEYKSFEGTIPKGEYGGGTVMLWDEGTWEPVGDVDNGLRAGMLKFTLHGQRLLGKWALIRLKSQPGDRADNWLLLKENDDYAAEADGISDFDTSVKTGRTMAEIAAGDEDKITRNPFDDADVQLARLVAEPPEGDGWLYELKYDGYRILGYAEAGAVRLMTRNGHDFTRRFQAAADALNHWSRGRAMVLDGEMVVTDDTGRTDFQALQRYMKNPAGRRLRYIVFDLLALDGADLRGRPLTERKDTLEALMKNAPDDLTYSPHVRGRGKESFGAACRAGMEGIVGKRADSAYSGTRNGDWIKIKCDNRQEFVIGGYTRTDRKTEGISALLLGVYDGPDLVYAGRAGTGLSERGMKGLEEKFDKIKRPEPPFRAAPKPKSNEKFIWLDPVLVAEIKFAEWTGDGQLRQASFKGLRADKDPKEVRMEKPDGGTPTEDIREPSPGNAKEAQKSMNVKEDSLTIGGVTISSPGKVIFEDPAVTKADVVRYYDAVSARMLPYVRGRILSIVRCPRGIAQACFYKKHPGPDNKGIVTIPITNSDGQTEDYFYIEDAVGLIQEAQMGTLEFHTWGSRAEALETPDVMVFDLDPDEGMAPDQIRRGVRDLKSILEQLSLLSYLKTSGGKGYHVVVPFTPSAGWDAFHDFARRIAEVIAEQWPDRYTSNVRKNKRGNKIFIDWMRNGRGATSIAPYSLRARKGARVSMPIPWQELGTVVPDGITMENAIGRIGGPDPWQGFFETDQRLKV